ncbi:UNVERIFIED_CONTAM: hypothetical protein PYX00_001462 [Menopon gallinae]|uniref:Uncharacterized protein n=1 Tax=Menopon gallinae TaxID=328185 RepID=A0AAW2ICU6_9NEOP
MKSAVYGLGLARLRSSTRTKNSRKVSSFAVRTKTHFMVSDKFRPFFFGVKIIKNPIPLRPELEVAFPDAKNFPAKTDRFKKRDFGDHFACKFSW